MIAGSVALVVSRRDALRSEHRLDSLLSREAVFLGNNLVLVGLCVRRLLGHVLPAHLRGGDGRQGVGRPAVVRPLHRAAGARARAAERASARSSRGAARPPRAPVRNLLRPALVGVAVVSWPRPRRRRVAADRRCMFGARRVRDRRRRRRSSGAARGARRAMSGEAPSARARLARAAQPPPLRRLHRPRRAWRSVHRRRGVVGVPARARRAPDARADDAQSAATRSPTSGRRRGIATTADGRLEKIELRRRCSTCSATASTSRRCAPSAATTRRRRRRARPGRALLRGRGDERGRPAGRAHARRVDRDDARHRRAAADHRRGRQGLRERSPTIPTRPPRPRSQALAAILVGLTSATAAARRPRRSASSPRRW